jgi:hypothetical protein
MGDWKAERDADAAERTLEAQVLVGKTIASATVTPDQDDTDDVGLLVLEMVDGSKFHVTGYYLDYTGHSVDEFQTAITVAAAP